MMTQAINVDELDGVTTMGQRKGLFRWVTVEVCRADEQAVRDWLQVRWEHMKEL